MTWIADVDTFYILDSWLWAELGTSRQKNVYTTLIGYHPPWNLRTRVWGSSWKLGPANNKRKCCPIKVPPGNPGFARLRTLSWKLFRPLFWASMCWASDTCPFRTLSWKSFVALLPITGLSWTTSLVGRCFDWKLFWPSSSSSKLWSFLTLDWKLLRSTGWFARTLQILEGYKHGASINSATGSCFDPAHHRPNYGLSSLLTENSFGPLAGF